MSLKQLTIFVENKQGALVDITKTLADKHVDIRALSIADTEQFGILRLIVNDNEKATKALLDSGCIIKITAQCLKHVLRARHCANAIVSTHFPLNDGLMR